MFQWNPTSCHVARVPLLLRTGVSCPEASESLINHRLKAAGCTDQFHKAMYMQTS